MGGCVYLGVVWWEESPWRDLIWVIDKGAMHMELRGGWAAEGSDCMLVLTNKRFFQGQILSC